MEILHFWSPWAGRRVPSQSRFWEAKPQVSGLATGSRTCAAYVELLAERCILDRHAGEARIVPPFSSLLR
jgi:hypothetical protein